MFLLLLGRNEDPKTRRERWIREGRVLPRDVLLLILAFVPDCVLYGVQWACKVFSWPNEGSFKGGKWHEDDNGEWWFLPNYCMTKMVCMMTYDPHPKRVRKNKRHGKKYKWIHPEGGPRNMCQGTLKEWKVKGLVDVLRFSRMILAFLMKALGYQRDMTSGEVVQFMLPKRKRKVGFHASSRVIPREIGWGVSQGGSGWSGCRHHLLSPETAALGEVVGGVDSVLPFLSQGIEDARLEESASSGQGIVLGSRKGVRKGLFRDVVMHILSYLPREVWYGEFRAIRLEGGPSHPANLKAEYTSRVEVIQGELWMWPRGPQRHYMLQEPLRTNPGWGSGGSTWGWTWRVPGKREGDLWVAPVEHSPLLSWQRMRLCQQWALQFL